MDVSLENDVHGECSCWARKPTFTDSLTVHSTGSVENPLVAWNPSGSATGPYTDFHLNGGDAFWAVLAHQASLGTTGLAGIEF
jgi:hypothetical protein